MHEWGSLQYKNVAMVTVDKKRKGREEGQAGGQMKA
jgi:hypothetical protein